MLCHMSQFWRFMSNFCSLVNIDGNYLILNDDALYVPVSAEPGKTSMGWWMLVAGVSLSHRNTLPRVRAGAVWSYLMAVSPICLFFPPLPHVSVFLAIGLCVSVTCGGAPASGEGKPLCGPALCNRKTCQEQRPQGSIPLLGQIGREQSELSAPSQRHTWNQPERGEETASFYSKVGTSVDLLSEGGCVTEFGHLLLTKHHKISPI